MRLKFSAAVRFHSELPTSKRRSRSIKGAADTAPPLIGLYVYDGVLLQTDDDVVMAVMSAMSFSVCGRKTAASNNECTPVYTEVHANICQILDKCPETYISSVHPPVRPSVHSYMYPYIHTDIAYIRTHIKQTKRHSRGT